MNGSQWCRDWRFAQLAWGRRSNTALHATGAVSGRRRLENLALSARA